MSNKGCGRDRNGPAAKNGKGRSVANPTRSYTLKRRRFWPSMRAGCDGHCLSRAIPTAKLSAASSALLSCFPDG